MKKSLQKPLLSPRMVDWEFFFTPNIHEKIIQIKKIKKYIYPA